ncbi:17.4 kDa class I heat shock protein [Platanthera guangdongensis]|uniref:17.4 kDa class I heat shock protein n=1 Tax=Platanthera guangdongensis TaxID=2320717 RepID=A0ABR2MLQ6_9ASPA
MSIVPRSSIVDPLSLDIWSPLDAFTSAIESAFAAPRSNYAFEAETFANTLIDWKETPEAHVFKVDLPGLKKEEVKVEVEDGCVLQISDKRKRSQEETAVRWHRIEHSSGKFLCRFRLPENARVDQLKASMENGVLTVVVPKEEAKKPVVKSIDISGEL